MKKPYQSVLTQHYALIRDLRYKRKTWKEIAAHLGSIGITISAPGVYLFFKRARKHCPLGLPQHGKEPNTQPTSTQQSVRARLEALKARTTVSDSTDKGFRTGADVIDGGNQPLKTIHH